jgi:hypothetical protein
MPYMNMLTNSNDTDFSDTKILSRLSPYLCDKPTSLEIDLATLNLSPLSPFKNVPISSKRKISLYHTPDLFPQSKRTYTDFTSHNSLFEDDREKDLIHSHISFKRTRLPFPLVVTPDTIPIRNAAIRAELEREKPLEFSDILHPQMKKAFAKSVTNEIIKESSPAVSDFLDHASQIFDSTVTNTANTMNQTVREVGDSIKNDAHELFGGIKQTLTDMLGSTIKYASSWIDSLASLVLTLYNMYNVENYVLRGTILLQYLFSTGLITTTGIYNKILSGLEFIHHVFTTPILAVEASGILFTVAASSFFVTLAALLIRKIKDNTTTPFHSDSHFEQFTEELSAQAGREWNFDLFSKKMVQMKSLGQAFEYFSNMFWYAFAWCYHKIFGVPYSSDKNAVWISDTLQWVTEVQSKISSYSAMETQMIISIDVAREFIRLHKKGDELSTTLLSLGYTHANFTSFFTALKLVKDIADQAEYILKNADTRFVPLFVQFSGTPATGKSVAIHMICQDLWTYYRKFLDPAKIAGEWNANLRYERNPKDKYWSQYANQPFVTFDDFLQIDDKQLRTELLADIIHAVNNNPYILTMADLQDKGKVKFDSMVVLATSNTDANGHVNTPAVDLQDMVAYKSRRDFLFKVTIDPEFEKIRTANIASRDHIQNVTNPERRSELGETSNTTPFTRAAYVFSPYDVNTETPLLDPETSQPLQWTYDQMFAHLVLRLKQKRTPNSDVSQFLKNNPINCDRISELLKQLEIDALKPIVRPKRVPFKPTPFNVDLRKPTVTLIQPASNLPYPKVTRTINANGQVVETHHANPNHSPNDIDSNGPVSDMQPQMLKAVTSYFSKDEDEDEDYFDIRPEPEEVPLRMKVPSGVPIPPIHFSGLDSLNPIQAPDSVTELPIPDSVNVKHYVEDFETTYSPYGTRNNPVASEELARPYRTLFQKFLDLKPVSATVLFIDQLTTDTIGFLKNHPFFSACLVLIPVAFLCFKLYKVFTRITPHANLASTGASQGLATQVEPKRNLSKKRFRLDAQDGNCIDILQTCTLSNSAKMTVSIPLPEGGYDNLCINAVFLFSNVCAIPKHFADKLKGNSVTLTFYSGRSSLEFKYDPSKIMRLDDTKNDLVFIRISQLQPFRDITKLFFTSKEFESLNLSRTSTYRYTIREGKIISEIISSNDSYVAGNVKYSENDRIYHSTVGIEYHGVFRNGDCGNLVGIRNEFLTRKLTGIHVAGNKSRGRCAIITSEDCQVLKETFLSESDSTLQVIENLPTDSSPLIGHAENSTGPQYEYKHFLYLGSVPKEQATRFPSRSEIVRAPWHGLLAEPTKAPAALRPFYGPTGETISPLQKAITKLEKPSSPPLDLLLAGEISDAFFSKVPANYPARVLTEDEVINGEPNSRFIKSIDMSTSAGYTGYPTHVVSKKSDLFDGLPGEFVPNLILRSRIDSHIDNYRKEIYGKSISTCHLKDELRPIQKVLDGKTRLFSCPEAAHLVLMKRYFGAFVENIGLAPEKTGVAMGINPCSTDWSLIRDAMLKCKPAFELDGDSECHDGSCNSDLVDLFILGVNAWYKDHDPNWKLEDDQMRRGLMLDGTYKAVLLIGSDLVSVRRLIISGIFLTFIFQSFTTHVIHPYTLKKACDKYGYAITVAQILENSHILAGGDDYVHSLNEIFNWYNFTMFQEEVKQMGYSYTPPDKISTTYLKREVGDVEFLKRRFVNRGGILHAPLDLNTVLEIMNWIKKTAPYPLAFAQSSSSALLEAYQHGPTIFNIVKTKINNAAVRLNYPVTYLTYNGIESEYGVYDYKHFEEPLVPQMYKFKSEDVSSKADLFYKMYNRAPQIDFFQKGLDFVAVLKEASITIHTPPLRSKQLAREYVLTEFFNQLEAHVERDNSQPPVTIVPLPTPPPMFTSIPPAPTYVVDPEPLTPDKAELQVQLNRYRAVYAHLPITAVAYNKQFQQFHAVLQHLDAKGGNFIRDPHTGAKFFGFGVTRADALANSIKVCFDVLNRPFDFVEPRDTTSLLPQSGNEANFEENTEGEVETQVLTTTKDIVASEDQVNPGRFQLYKDTDPYPDQGMVPVLSRKYRTAELIWSGSSVAGTQLYFTQFPYALISTSSVLADKILGFKWFRADVDVEIRLNGTQFHYGKLLIAWLPHNYSGGSTPWKLSNIWTASSCNAVTVSANTNKTVKFTIPYTLPLQYWDTTRNLDFNGDFGTFVIYVLNPLNLTGAAATPTISVSIFANFRNPSVAGPTLNTATFNMDALFVPHMKKTVVKEQKQKTEKGIVSGVAQAVSDIATSVSKLPFLPPQISLGASAVAGGTGIIGSIASMLGFDKPQNLAAPMAVHPDTFSSYATGDGLFTGQELGLQEGMHMATDPGAFNEKELCTSLLSLAMMPGLYQQFTFDATSPAGTVVDACYVTPSTCYTTRNTGSTLAIAANTPVSAVASQFKYWRGPMKYRGEIVCSKFLSGRLRIGWHPTFGEIPAVGSTIGSGEGDIISEVIDFTGDTSFNFTIPFLSSFLYLRCNDSLTKSEDGSNGGISFSIVNPCVANQTTSSTTVYVNLYCAAGEGMQFHVLCDKPTIGTYTKRDFVSSFTLQSVVVPQSGEAESNVLVDIFAQKFPTLIPATGKMYNNIVAPEDINSIYTLLHRPVAYPATAKTQAVWAIDSAFGPGNRLDPTLVIGGATPWSLFSLWSNYYKGGFNHWVNYNGTASSPDDLEYLKIVFFNMTLGVVVFPPNSTVSPNIATSNTPHLIQNLTDRKGLMFHEPYRSLLPYSSTTNATSYAFASYNRENTVGAYFQSQGAETTITINWAFAPDDDFRFAWIVGPPAMMWS